MEDPEFWLNYFIDYFGNVIEYGTVGTYRIYDVTDFDGMNKATAMDIIDNQYSLYTNIPRHLSFENWFLPIKHSSFYTAVYLYLFNAYHNTPNDVEYWFQAFYNIHI
jgi:hypothetical protein